MRHAMLTLGILAVCGGASFAAYSNTTRKGDAVAKAARVSAAIKGHVFSISDAVKAAEAETGGKAVASELEIEGGRAVVEVLILKAGDPPQLLEVEVEGQTNKILEIEQDDSDSGDDGDSDDSDDDTDDDNE